MRQIQIILGCSLLLAACSPTSETNKLSSTQAAGSPYLVETQTPTFTLLPGFTEIMILTPTPLVHIVVPGDTLEAIASKYDISLVNLMAANPGVQPTALIVGMELIIPVDLPPTSAMAPTPVPIPVQQARCWPESSGGLWCFALVLNDSTEPLENISAQFTLLGKDEREIANQVGYAPLNLLPAGEVMPLGVHFPPGLDSQLQLHVQVLTATRMLPGDVRYLPVMLENVLVSIDSSRRTAQISGRVMLTMLDGHAETLWVLGIAYDETGTLVGFRRWDAGFALSGGESVDFSFLLSSMGPAIERVTFLTEARP